MSENGPTVDTSLRKFCCKGLIKNGDGAGEHMHESKGGLLLLFFFKDGKYSLTTQIMVCI